ncbi:MAG: putative toxin-antitoxin system toxin component, PIN family [Desulfobacteraceae bacterium]|jgi:putative PIN family toxin of toxin-antitoxin system|nr:putative toxin-antitoxin system toxin component, PIN family [Desulfobacteraceae bacterium]
MRIVIDCNVFVSASLGGKDSTCGKVIRKVLVEHDILYSDCIIEEIKETAKKPKLKSARIPLLNHIKQLHTFGLKVSATSSEIFLPDPDDEEYLKVALTGGAGIIITGNKKDFPAEKCQGVKILSPREFLDS